ncbi:hypothetical protein GSU69_09200 [Rathayibacter festucae]|uniref:YhcG N-terminal domain-containing protein n=1 Tax=Rathayibacter festucae TaxID=110937 RepID=A0ABX6GZK7_9MICO|nr:hypothetical protein GSU69_09200 [Rathayibacter festucae]
MRAFTAAWPEPGIGQQAVARLPWGHDTVLLDRLDERAARDWSVEGTVDRACSRNMRPGRPLCRHPIMHIMSA